MKERPILFSPAMVRAILAGQKTQTRRIVEPQPDSIHDGEPYWNIGGYRGWPFRGVADPVRMGTHKPLVSPYGQVGDLLWVKETHYLYGIWSTERDEDGKRYWSFKPIQDRGVAYEEPNGLITGRSTAGPGWYKRNSLFMPRWASRITLQITQVRLERLCEISSSDCQSEGVAPPQSNDVTLWRRQFEAVWESINGPGSWQANPWVWAISFKRVN